MLPLPRKTEPGPEPERLGEVQRSERELIRIEDLRWQHFPAAEPQSSLEQVEAAGQARPKPRRVKAEQLS